MINKTEEVCPLENWIHDISVNLEQIEQQFLLQDPYDSVWLKIMAILFYFIGLFSSATMLAFINYESGHHGNFRSVINQLLSNLYAMVSLPMDFFIYGRNCCHFFLLIFPHDAGTWDPNYTPGLYILVHDLL